MGTHVLPEDERLHVLSLIASGQEKVNAALDKLPFVIDTYGLKVGRLLP